MVEKIDIRKKLTPPTHPGVFLAEDFLKPLGVSQSEFARRVGISFQRLNDIIHARRELTIDTALRFAHVLGTSPQFWLNAQQAWDLWHAARGASAKEIEKLEPLTN